MSKTKKTILKKSSINKKIVTFFLFTCLLFSGYVFFKNSKPKYEEIGYASYYAKLFHGRKTANGQIYNMNKLTAAHRKLPFGTKIKVTNLENNKKVTVIINDRGPYAKKRILDLSTAAARKLDMIKKGVVKVKIEHW